MSQPVTFTYRNWRGEVSERLVLPLDMTFDDNPYHSGPQWFLNGLDIARFMPARRSFAVEDILSPIRHVDPVSNH